MLARLQKKGGDCLKRKFFYIFLCLIWMMALCSCGEKEKTTETQTDSLKTTESKKEIVEPQVPSEYAMAAEITINPKLKLYFDSDKVVIGVEYLNEDAKIAFQEVDFLNVTLDECMKKLVDAAVEHEFLADGKNVDIKVVDIQDSSYDETALREEWEQTAKKALEEKGVKADVTVESDGTKESTEETTEEPTTESTTEEITQPPSTEAPKSVCSTCGGSGKCWECKGDGYRGAGFTVSCPRCHGSLTETCIYCDAAGNSTKHEGTCDFPNCMGRHVYSCTTCNGGTKPVTCASCGGSGICSSCGGR